jgi:hypothetical protein
MKTLAVVFAAMLVSSASALAAPGSPTPPRVTYSWKSTDCTSLPSLVSHADAAGRTTVELACRHGAAWGTPVYGCPKDKILTLLLNNTWVCTKK